MPFLSTKLTTNTLRPLLLIITACLLHLPVLHALPHAQPVPGDDMPAPSPQETSPDVVPILHQPPAQQPPPPPAPPLQSVLPINVPIATTTTPAPVEPEIPEYRRQCFYADEELCDKPLPAWSQLNSDLHGHLGTCHCRPHPTVSTSWYCCNITHMSMISSCSNTSLWTNLHIRNVTLHELDLSHSLYQTLQSLAITDGNITKLVGGFSRFSSIKCLNVSNNNLSEITQRGLIPPNLKVLDISQNNLTGIPNFNQNQNITVDVSGNNNMLCFDIYNSIFRDSLLFVNQENSFCLQNFTFRWFNSTDLISIKELVKWRPLNTDCPSIPGYGNCTCKKEHMVTTVTGDQSESITKIISEVDCSNLGLVELPPKLPENTFSLNVSNNKITNIGKHFHENPTYQSLIYLVADDNKISTMYDLEGTAFMEHFQRLYLRNNALSSMKEPDDINFSEVHTETDSDVNYTPECSTSISLEKDREAVFEATSLINRGLEIIGVSPIQKKKVNQKRYSTEKMQNVSEAISGKIFGIPSDDNVCLDENDGNEILQTLKDAFATTSDRAKQVRILTICKDWPHRKIQHHFPSATVHMITVAKKIAEEKGILAEANPKSHPSLEREVIDLITQFYELDENSRVMPGKKDFVSVKINNERIHVQKRLLLINLRELHQMFKENHPTVKCSFSKFATLRPKHCVLAGSSGTHSVCVCTIHENVKLLVEGPNIKHLTAESVHPIKSYQDCLKRMLCLNASTNSYFGKCAQCPGATNLIDEIRTILEDSFIEEITYRQWVNVDRTTLQVMVSPVDKYLQKLESGLKKLLLHSFIVKSQNKFINSKKESLPENECIVLCDFSENYAFVVQNSAQGIHWNNNQATIHPFAIYYKHGSGEIRMKSFVVISDCLHHNTIAVHLFQKYLVEYVKNNFENISKITYFSDGASAQYKNKKNFVNLTHHQKDFGLSAEWHFFPTSHGKNACDGLGGTLKRLAARASLQRANNPIQTPKELFDWAIAAIPNISFKYVENEEYYKEEKNLEARFKKAVAVKGTLAYHCMIPVAEGTAKAKFFSLDDHSVEVQVMK